MTMRVAMTAMFSRALPVRKSFGRRAFLLAGALSAAAASPVNAADILRGSYVTSPQYYQWDGFYAGVQAGYTNVDAKFGNATQLLTDHILRNSTIQDNVSGWTTLANGSTNGSSYGGFIGYNWQWDDVVVGVEANYSRTSLSKTTSDSLGRSFIDNDGALPGYNYNYSMLVSGGSTVKLTDLATFRARAGWAVGSLLPYAFLGFAVARADVTTTASVSGSLNAVCDGSDPGCVPFGFALNLPGPQSVSRQGVFTYGGSIGLGFDWALSQNLFVRGEWELVQLQEVEGVDLRINTARAAVGVKF
jgi:hypothetical protein